MSLCSSSCVDCWVGRPCVIRERARAEALQSKGEEVTHHLGVAMMDVRLLTAKVEALQADRDEALENIERMKLRYYEIDTERMRLESECERLTRERVDIGVKYDLLRARIDAKGTET